MATPNTDTVLSTWLADIGEPFRRSVPCRVDGRRIIADGYVLRHAWRQTDLAEYLPSARGRRALWLMNGDRLQSDGPFQPDLQWIVRRAVQRRAVDMDVPCLVLPFSALEGANIDRSTIRALDIRADESWNEVHYADEFRHVPIHERTLQREETRYADRLELVPVQLQRGYHWNGETLKHEYLEREPDADGRYSWTVNVPYNRPRDADGRYSWTVHRHRLGDSLFTAETVETHSRRREWSTVDVVRAAVDLVHAERQDLADAGITYRGRERNEYATKFHEVRTAGRRLAELELTPHVDRVQVRRRRRFVSSFDTLEPFPAYFLATLPHSSRARTVGSAIEDLAPAAVHAALARGRDVKRQGDIFLIGTDLADETVHAMARTRARLTLWTRTATPRVGEPGYVPALSAAKVRAFRRFRRDEWRRNLRDVVARAVDSGTAYPQTTAGARGRFRALRADRERIRAHHNQNLRRAILQGDARGARNSRSHIETYRGPASDSHGAEHVPMSRDRYRTGYGSNAVSAWARADTAARERFYPRVPFASRRDEVRRALSIHGTAHSATEVATTRDGRVYVRGIVRHVPALAGENRERDHVDVRLGAGWYLAVRNTVPRLRDTA